MFADVMVRVIGVSYFTSVPSTVSNKTLWSSYTEIIDVKQCHPNTALVGVQVDSEQKAVRH